MDKHFYHIFTKKYFNIKKRSFFPYHLSLILKYEFIVIVYSKNKRKTQQRNMIIPITRPS